METEEIGTGATTVMTTEVAGVVAEAAKADLTNILKAWDLLNMCQNSFKTLAKWKREKKGGVDDVSLYTCEIFDSELEEALKNKTERADTSYEKPVDSNL